MDRETTYSLREADEEDFAWLRQLHHATMRDTVAQIWGWDEARQEVYFREHFDAHRLSIIQIAGRDIGVLEVEDRPEEIFLADIQIDPLEQGKGIGSAVLLDLQRRAVARQVPLTLQVNRANRARALYERLGFTVTGETETHYQMRWVPPGPHAS